jgi:uncharacterized metal-binding protein
MMTGEARCACQAAPKLVFACSGAADVGAIADKAARQLSADGVGKMFCLAGVGGRVTPILDTTRAASAVVAIDGCPMDCARHTLEQAEIEGFVHVRLADLGMEKGKAPVTDDRVQMAVGKAAELLQA